MNIGILYMCTGAYAMFFKRFYDSVKEKFLPEDEKTFYVWTDSTDEYFNQPDVIKFYQKHLGWPRGTMNRFHQFLEHEDKINKHDYLFFFNANIVCNKPVGREILPTEDDDWLCAVLHLAFADGRRGTFETNPKSTAFIPLDTNPPYFQGCLSGGRTPEYLEMCRTCKKNIDIDDSNGILAVWFDESHSNKYFSTKKVKRLHPGYAHPEGGWTLHSRYEKLMTQLEKFNYPNFSR